MTLYGNLIIKFYYCNNHQNCSEFKLNCCNNDVGDEDIGFEIYYNPETKLISICRTYSTNMSVLTCDSEDYLVKWYYQNKIDILISQIKNDIDIQCPIKNLNKNDYDYFEKETLNYYILNYFKNITL